MFVAFSTLSATRAGQEVGTLAGYSAIAMARALPPEGRVRTIELSERHADFAQEWVARSDVAGKVEVQRSGEGVLATLGSGDVFGELSLLANTGSTANVRSISRVLALRMPASVFQEVIMTHPQVLAYLGELAERRTPRAQAEEFLDLHLDMLV